MNLMLILNPLTSSASDIFASAAAEARVSESILRAVCWVESGHNYNVKRVADGLSDSFGICQVKLATARHMGFKGGAKELLNPAVNALYAAKYLAFQTKRYSGNLLKGIVAYNKGHCSGDIRRSKYLNRVIQAHSENR